MYSIWHVAVGVVIIEITIVAILLLPLPRVIRNFMSKNLTPIRNVFLAPAAIFTVMGFNAYMGFQKRIVEEAHGSSALHFQVFSTIYDF
jgi:hypothetical protein